MTPQQFAGQQPSHCTAEQTPQREQVRIVKPYDEVSTAPDNIARYAVIPIRDPLILSNG
ncbi:MAG TPA: hypothetical protein VKQ72_22070 [Aggregatilineales bacterium]|nr:hypothetical protein [Aggregatilineales bacterium]